MGITLNYQYIRNVVHGYVFDPYKMLFTFAVIVSAIFTAEHMLSISSLNGQMASYCSQMEAAYGDKERISAAAVVRYHADKNDFNDFDEPNRNCINNAVRVIPVR